MLSDPRLGQMDGCASGDGIRVIRPCAGNAHVPKEGPTSPFLEAFRDRMRELGWVDG